MFLVGDYFHDCPSTDLDFYVQHTTRIDHAKELTSVFQAPVHVGFGNHDYAVPKVNNFLGDNPVTGTAGSSSAAATGAAPGDGDPG